MEHDLLKKFATYFVKESRRADNRIAAVGKARDVILVGENIIRCTSRHRGAQIHATLL